MYFNFPGVSLAGFKGPKGGPFFPTKGTTTQRTGKHVNHSRPFWSFAAFPNTTWVNYAVQPFHSFVSTVKSQQQEQYICVHSTKCLTILSRLPFIMND